ncbi:MAG: diguanylate cyclase [Candidatus Omnitrophica bacterium]|nr:diguanylate cyclase [Candidatus Omnitrophota bacterium]
MKSKVLVVEDDRNDLELLTQKLKNEPYELFIAETGKKAFNILEEQEIDMVILDVLLPDMDGFEICRRIRKHEKYAYVPVLFHTTVRTTDEKLIGLEMGASDFLNKTADERELLLRIRNLLHAKKAIDLLVKCSVKDALTNIYNKMYFQHRIEDEIHRSIRYKREFCCAIVDIDHFRQINDRMGYASGDRILKKMAQMLEGNIRGADILCRYSGDKFGWLLPETDIDDSYLAVERLRNFIITSKFGSNDEGISLTVSCGVSSFLYAQSGVKELFYQAGVALKKAKSEGRNQTRVYKGEKKLEV